MGRLVAIALLFATAVACGKNSPSTTPSNTQVAAPPAVVGAPLTRETLVSFVQDRFPAAVTAGTITLDFGSGGVDVALLEELSLLGITTTTQLAAIVPADYETKGIGATLRSEAPTTTIAGLIRDLLIIHDVRGYFTKAWRDGWVTTGPVDFPAPAAYGVDFKVMEELGAFGSGGGDHGERGNPCGDDDADGED